MVAAVAAAAITSQENGPKEAINGLLTTTEDNSAVNGSTEAAASATEPESDSRPAEISPKDSPMTAQPAAADPPKDQPESMEVDEVQATAKPEESQPAAVEESKATVIPGLGGAVNEGGAVKETPEEATAANPVPTDGQPKAPEDKAVDEPDKMFSSGEEDNAEEPAKVEEKEKEPSEPVRSF